LCIQSAQVSFAQKSDMVFHYLTADDGLSANNANIILRDDKDYVWIGTPENGINRYNSTQLKIYRNDPKNPESLSDNGVTCIAEDAEKQLWVGTYNGLNLYSPDHDSFIRFFNDPKDSNSISNNHINCIFKDKQGKLWIGTNGHEGLNRWDPASKKFKRFRVFDPKSKVEFGSIASIAQDKDGTIWIAGSADNGIMHFEPDKVEFTFYTSTSILSLKAIQKLFVDNDNQIWISTYGSGLFSFDPTTNKFTKYNSLGDGKGTNGKILSNIIQEDKNHLLIGVDQGGLNRYNKQTKLFEYIKYQSGNPTGLNNNGIWYLYKDTEGILWVGTSAGGVNFSNPKSEKFRLFRNIPGEPNSLVYNVVNSFFEDSDGLIWINTDGGGISVYNPRTGNFKNYKNKPSDPFSLPCNVIRQTVEDRNHNFWMGTWDGGYIKLDPKTEKFTRYLPESPKPYDLPVRTVWYNIIDSKGMMWLSMHGNGIVLFDPDKGITKRFRHDPEQEGSLSSNHVNFLYEDSHSNIWACTSGGLNYFDPLTNTFKVIRVGLVNDYFWSLGEDKEGCYWGGNVKNDLVRFKADGTVVKIYNASNGLPDSRINGILEDSKNNIWVSSNEGISRINYKTGEIRNFLEGDGLQGKGFLRNSGLKTRSGKMYFGGTNGFNSFYPDSIKDNPFLPKVHIDEFLLFNQPVILGEPNSPLHKSIDQTRELVLSWKQSVFSFGFVAVNYTHPEKNLYAYKMEGFDKDWNYTDASRRLATYTNLDAGEYTFRVKASNNDGVWNETGTSLKITILPPWWRTWWFNLFVVLCILSAASGFYFYRVNRLKKQKKYLEGIIELRTHEINVKNSKLLEQTETLSQINEVLVERNQQIEMRDEEIQATNEYLKDTNEQLIEKQEIILLQAEELKEANLKLKETDAAKDKFFSIIAHDLRGPFSAFLGLTEIMAEESSSYTIDQIQEFSVDMRKSASNLYRLLENLLQWSKMQQGLVPFNPELIPLNPLINECIVLATEQAKNKGIEITYDIADDLKVFSDTNMLQAVIRNLVSNAMKFTPKGGKISVSAIETNDKNVEISIQDSGIGMTSEMVNNLFRLDVKTNRRGTEGEPSSGLGLLLCKEFVEKQRGTIRVESEVGKGSAFKFTLPMGNPGQ